MGGRKIRGELRLCTSKSEPDYPGVASGAAPSPELRGPAFGADGPTISPPENSDPSAHLQLVVQHAMRHALRASEGEE